MNFKPLLFLFLCITLNLGAAEGESSQELADQLITCLEAGEKKAKAALLEVDAEDTAQMQVAQASVSSYTRALDSIRSLQALLESDNSREAVSQSISRLSYNRQTLPSECADLYLALTRALEREKRAELEAFELELDAFRTEVGEALLDAEAASDLDDLFLRLESLKERASKFRSSNSQFHTTTSNLTRIVSGWQDYLNYLSLGDQRQAESSLRNLNQSLTATPVVPRSKVLQMQNDLKRGAEAAKRALENGGNKTQAVASPPYTVRSVVEQIEEIEDLEPALDQLDALLAFRDTRSSAEGQQNNIRKLLDSVKLIEGGNALLGISALQNSGYSGSHTERFWVDPMRMQLRQYALYQLIPERFRVEAEEIPLETLIHKAAEHMMDEAAWVELWQLLKIAKNIYSQSNARTAFPSMDNDISAIESYIQARRLEETGQLNSALTYYNRVLAKTGFYGPYDEAKAAIVSLRDGRADELLADQKRIAEKPTPPISSDARARYMAMRGMSTDMRTLLSQPEGKQALDEAIAEQIALYLVKDEGAKGPSKAEAPTEAEKAKQK